MEPREKFDFLWLGKKYREAFDFLKTNSEIIDEITVEDLRIYVQNGFYKQIPTDELRWLKSHLEKEIFGEYEGI